MTYISIGWGQPSLSVFIGSESDHCLAAGSLSQSCLVDMTDVTLAEKDPHSKVIDVYQCANVKVGDMESIGDS